MALKVHDGLPPGLVDCEARELAGFLGGPTLLQLPGEAGPPLFVSTLLHGNELSGWHGVRRLLAERATLPRAMSLFIGNVTAAAADVRSLPGQPDYNRIWGGGEESAEGRALAHELEDAIAGVEFLASIDLHNNTGRNPHYAVVTAVEPANLGLAYLFSERAVWLEEPATVLTRIFATRCPAIALELGPVGNPRCDERAYDYVARCLELDAVPAASVEDIALYRALGRLHVPDGVAFSFADEAADTPLVLTAGMEAVNFHSLEPGTVFGTASRPTAEVLRMLDPLHREVTDEYFEQRDGEIRLRRAAVPAMYTTDPAVIRQDCLCYLMERV